MAKKKSDSAAFQQLKKDVADGNVRGAYIFYGEERYLLEYYLGAVKKKLMAEGLEEFNYKTFDGRSLSLPVLREALDALPVFGESTLITVWDYDIFKSGEEIKRQLAEILSDIPEYACLIFVYDITAYAPDKRLKANNAILSQVTPVEFGLQEQSDIVNWIGRRFRALGKKIDRPTAEYLAFITGGLMTQLVAEIEKTAAYARGEQIARSDIDAVVVPVLDAAIYRMTDAVISRRYGVAAGVLSDLLRMQEVPHVILYSLSAKLRQLLAARVCLNSGKGTGELMQLAGVRLEFQARNLMAGARQVSLDWCREALRRTYAAARRLNLSSKEGSGILTQLLLELSLLGE